MLLGKALLWVLLYLVGWDSSVGIMTRYRLDGSGIESRWGWDFPHSSRPALAPTQPPIQCVPGLYRGYSGRGVALTTHLPYSNTYGPLWTVQGWPLPLPYFLLLFCLSVWLHQCSMLIFFVILLLPETHVGEAGQPSNEVVFYRMSGSTGWRFLSCCYLVLKGSR